MAVEERSTKTSIIGRFEKTLHQIGDKSKNSGKPLCLRLHNSNKARQAKLRRKSKDDEHKASSLSPKRNKCIGKKNKSLQVFRNPRAFKLHSDDLHHCLVAAIITAQTTMEV